MTESVSVITCGLTFSLGEKSLKKRKLGLSQSQHRGVNDSSPSIDYNCSIYIYEVHGSTVTYCLWQ